jgi:hypothetical protein
MVVVQSVKMLLRQPCTLMEEEEEDKDEHQFYRLNSSN